MLCVQSPNAERTLLFRRASLVGNTPQAWTLNCKQNLAKLLLA
ncbi:MAG: hypothetical protein ACR2IA_08970 [Pyrinomonadaceae bacterium]